MEVREENEVGSQPGVLLRDRLLHLEQELGRRPGLVDGRDASAGRLVRCVGERATQPRAGLDQDVVAAAHELARAGGRQGDAMLVGLDLRDDADPHEGGSLTEGQL